jgi:hypothetical protein
MKDSELQMYCALFAGALSGLMARQQGASVDALSNSVDAAERVADMSMEVMKRKVADAVSAGKGNKDK